MKEKLYDYLVMLIFVELVVGGLGNLFGLPVRKALFAVGILYTLYMIYVDKVKIEKRYLMAIAVILIYVAFGCIIGLVKRNNIRGIIGDANSFLGIIYLLLLVTYFKGNVKKINKGIDIIVDSSVVVAIITIALFFLSRIYLPGDQGIILKYMELNNTLQYGLITGLVHSNSYARVYLFNGIFMQIGALIIMTRLLFSSYECKISHKFKLLILLIGIYTSTTRGFWLGTAAGVVCIVIYFLWKRKEHKLILKRFLAVFVIFGIFIAIIPYTVDKNYAATVPIESGTESAKDRVQSMVDFENNISNRIRFIQLEYLGEKIKEKPIDGWGFGARLTEYKDFMIENNMPAVDDSNFELYYIELIYKTGILGGIFFFGYIIYKFIQLLMLLFKYKLAEKDEQVLVAWSIAFISFFVSGITNPYLASLCGFFVFVFESYILETIRGKYIEK